MMKMQHHLRTILFKLLLFFVFFTDFTLAGDLSRLTAGDGYRFSCIGPHVEPPKKHPYGMIYEFKSDLRGAIPLEDHVKANLLQIGTINFQIRNESSRTTGAFDWRLEVKKRKERNFIFGETIRGQKMDFIIAQEIDSVEWAKDFIRDELNNEYFMMMLPNHLTHPQFNGFFIRKKLAADIEVRSYLGMNHEYFGKNVSRFDKDAPLIILRSKVTKKPLFAVLNVHLKTSADAYVNVYDIRSGKTRKFVDYHSEEKKKAQLEGITQIISSLESEFGKSFPLIIGGDFNVNLPGSPLQQALNSQGYEDAFDLKGMKTDDLRRLTHTMIDHTGEKLLRQIDGFFVRSSIFRRLVPFIVSANYRNRPGRPQFGVGSLNGPSDHQMVKMAIGLPRE
jgi:hypothetical protein